MHGPPSSLPLSAPLDARAPTPVDLVAHAFSSAVADVQANLGPMLVGLLPLMLVMLVGGMLQVALALAGTGSQLLILAAVGGAALVLGEDSPAWAGAASMVGVFASHGHVVAGPGGPAPALPFRTLLAYAFAATIVGIPVIPVIGLVVSVATNQVILRGVGPVAALERSIDSLIATPVRNIACYLLGTCVWTLLMAVPIVGPLCALAFEARLFRLQFADTPGPRTPLA